MNELISVVVSTYERPDALSATLRGLSRQSDRRFCEIGSHAIRLPPAGGRPVRIQGTSIESGTTTVPQCSTSSACLPSTIGK